MYILEYTLAKKTCSYLKTLRFYDMMKGRKGRRLRPKNGGIFMRNKKPLFAGLAAAGMVASFAMGATAVGALQEVKAYLNSGITIKYNGEEQVMKDAQGVRIYPITYNGTTYVPIRAVSDMLEVGVDWDSASQTVLLGDPADGVDMIGTLKAYFLTDVYGSNAVHVQDSDKQNMEISGIPCTHWLQLNLGRYAAVGDKVAGAFNVQGKYDTLTFQYYSDKDTTLQVLGDNDAVLAEVNVAGGQTAHSLTVPLMKNSQVKFQAEKINETGLTQRDDIHVYIFDAKLK